MKKRLLAAVALIAVCGASMVSLMAQAAEYPRLQFIGGYRFIGDTGAGYSFTHNTHPDDSFLPNAKAPGSAGKTSVSGGGVSAALFAARYNFSSSSDVHFSLEGGVVTTIGRPVDRRQNANDTRPAPAAAFVYSHMDELGYYAAASVMFDLSPQWYAGVQGEWIGIRYSSGWERYAKEQEVFSSLRSLPAANLKLGYRVADGIALEAVAGYGTAATYGAQLAFGF